MRIWSFENWRSISTVRNASFTLRAIVFSGERKTARASCWVSVEAPCDMRRVAMSFTSAPPMRTRSMPLWS